MTRVTYCPSNADADRKWCEAVLPANKGLVVDWVTAMNNTALRLTDVPKTERTIISGAFADLVAVAAASYIADECVSRANTPDGWSREFEIIAPVAESSRFSNICEMLADAMQFVSGDKYSIRTTMRSTGVSLEVGLPKTEQCDAICLFSGGVDSLAGAIHLLDEGKKVCLVSHYADPLTISIHDALRTRLEELYPGQVDYRPCFVRRRRGNKKQTFPLPDKVDNTHRVRSVLFVALAAIHADLYDVNRIYMPENGIIGLNIPLDSSRAGALSTRTSHPFLIAKLCDIISSLAGRDTIVINPFLVQSKIEIVSSLPRTTYQLLEDTHSCAKYDMIRWTGQTSIRHCGYCLPCIYRRMAFHNIGIDRREDYLKDIFNELPKLSHNMTRDLRSLAAFLVKYQRSDLLKRRAMVMANGSIPFARLSAISETEKDISIGEVIDFLDRFVADAIRILRGMCSKDVLNVLGL